MFGNKSMKLVYLIIWVLFSSDNTTGICLNKFPLHMRPDSKANNASGLVIILWFLNGQRWRFGEAGSISWWSIMTDWIAYGRKQAKHCCSLVTWVICRFSSPAFSSFIWYMVFSDKALIDQRLLMLVALRYEQNGTVIITGNCLGADYRFFYFFLKSSSPQDQIMFKIYSQNIL